VCSSEDIKWRPVNLLTRDQTGSFDINAHQFVIKNWQKKKMNEWLRWSVSLVYK